jgi:hypothetical protein
MRAELLTGFDDGYAPVAKLTVPAMRAYADRHGITFTVERFLPSERATSWLKIPAIRNALGRGSDPVIWIDADALIVRPTHDLRSGLDPTKEFFIRMLFRNRDWSRWFLDTIWNGKLEPEHPTWENAALVHLLGFRGVLGRGEADQPNPAILAHVGALDDRWNVMPMVDATGKRAFIRHYAGVPTASRPRLIRRDAKLPFGGDLLMPMIIKAELKLAALEQRMKTKAERANAKTAASRYRLRQRLAAGLRRFIAPQTG